MSITYGEQGGKKNKKKYFTNKGRVRVILPIGVLWRNPWILNGGMGKRKAKVRCRVPLPPPLHQYK